MLFLFVLEFHDFTGYSLEKLAQNVIAGIRELQILEKSLYDGISQKKRFLVKKKQTMPWLLNINYRD